MLTVAHCREYLDAETSAAMSDDEVVRLRDDMYALARIILDAQINEEKLSWKNMD